MKQCAVIWFVTLKVTSLEDRHNELMSVDQHDVLALSNDQEGVQTLSGRPNGSLL
jgi:hypothetical protein